MAVIDFNVKLTENILTRYMAVNFNKYSNVSFLTFVCTVFISSKDLNKAYSGTLSRRNLRRLWAI